MSKSFYNVLLEDTESSDNTTDNEDTYNDVSHNMYVSTNRKRNFLNSRDESLNSRIRKFEKKTNHKKILCQNVLLNNKCTYSEKCLYAHSLEEQKIDIKRKKIFDLIDNDMDLSFIDNNKHKDIYRDLLIFTKPCLDCINKKCNGGYNCKFGSPLIKYTICYDDLNYGNCMDNNCVRVHLTKKGLKPLYNNISVLLNQPNIDNIFMLKPIMNNILLINSNANINYINNDVDSESDTECDNSIFTSKFDNIELFD